MNFRDGPLKLCFQSSISILKTTQTEFIIWYINDSIMNFRNDKLSEIYSSDVQ